MGWVYLDDKFPDNEKVVLAGGDATLMWIYGLAYCNRNTTGGRIPKALVARLTDRKSPAKLAERLCTVKLWDDDGEFYLVHGYDEWQRSATAEHEARVEKAKKAAEARWRKDAQSNAQASSEHVPKDMPEQSPDDASRAGSQLPTPHSQLWLSSPQQREVVAANGTAESEISRPQKLTNRLVEVCTLPAEKTRAEAAKVVDMCLQHADWTLVDEAIGICAQLDNRPKYPRYLFKVFRDHAGRAGLRVPHLELVP